MENYRDCHVLQHVDERYNIQGIYVTIDKVQYFLNVIDVKLFT